MSGTAPDVLVQKLLHGAIDSEVIQWLQTGFTRWARAGRGDRLPLERLLRLPTERKQRQERRRYHLRRLGALLADQHPPGEPLFRAVARALSVFLCQGSHARFRAAGGPGFDATPIQLELWKIASNLDKPGQPLSPRTVRRALAD